MYLVERDLWKNYIELPLFKLRLNVIIFILFETIFDKI